MAGFRRIMWLVEHAVIGYRGRGNCVGTQEICQRDATKTEPETVQKRAPIEDQIEIRIHKHSAFHNARIMVHQRLGEHGCGRGVGRRNIG